MLNCSFDLDCLKACRHLEQEMQFFLLELKTCLSLFQMKKGSRIGYETTQEAFLRPRCVNMIQDLAVSYFFQVLIFQLAVLMPLSNLVLLFQVYSLFDIFQVLANSNLLFSWYHLWIFFSFHLCLHRMSTLNSSSCFYPRTCLRFYIGLGMETFLIFRGTRSS
jgi:hypothetical protein